MHSLGKRKRAELEKSENLKLRSVDPNSLSEAVIVQTDSGCFARRRKSLTNGLVRRVYLLPGEG
jgi:hypothetical protein